MADFLIPLDVGLALSVAIAVGTVAACVVLLVWVARQ
jgi:hypothetical protein